MKGLLAYLLRLSPFGYMNEYRRIYISTAVSTAVSTACYFCYPAVTQSFYPPSLIGAILPGFLQTQTALPIAFYSSSIAHLPSSITLSSSSVTHPPSSNSLLNNSPLTSLSLTHPPHTYYSTAQYLHPSSLVPRSFAASSMSTPRYLLHPLLPVATSFI